MSSGGRSCLVPVWWEEGSGSRGCHGRRRGLPWESCPLLSFPRARCPRAGPRLSRRSRSVLEMQPQSLAARRGEPGDKTG